MKKLMILAVAALMLTACGNKTKNAATDADSLAAETTTVDTTATKNAITAQVKAIYEFINQYKVEGGYYSRDNDTNKRFTTKEWQEAVAAVNKADAGREGEEDFFEAFFPGIFSYWTMEYEGPVKVSDIHVTDIRSDGRAHVDFTLKGEDKEAQEVGWDLKLQDGQWRVYSIYKESRNMLGEMHHYVDVKKFCYSGNFDIHKYDADMNKQAHKVLNAEGDMLIKEFTVFDIDRDGTPEVLVRCPDQETLVLFSVAKGQVKCLAYAEGNSTLEFYEHGAGSISGCGIGCQQARYVLIKNSQSADLFRNHKQYNPEGQLEENEWESENGDDLPAAEGEKRFLQLGFPLNIQPDRFDEHHLWFDALL